MRFLRTVGGSFATSSSAFDRRQIIRWAGVSVTIAVTTAAVLLASFLAVALALT
jgi:hypothetical protein